MNENEKDQAVDIKDFLGIRVLTPLEEDAVEGGMAVGHDHDHTSTEHTDHDHA